MIKLVYGILPAFITHVESAKKSGSAKGPFIKIRTKHSFDIGLLYHELTHVKQWYRTLSIHSLLCLCSKWYRKVSETEAYRVQLKLVKNREHSLERFVQAMVNNYKLDITEKEARDLLTK